MNNFTIKTLIILIGFIVCMNAKPEPKPQPAKNDGRNLRSIDSSNYNFNTGFYQPYNNYKNGKQYFSDGRYLHVNYPYIHVHDNRELGQYVHIHIPYDGGYGPYAGDQDKYRYLFDNRGDYNLYTTTTTTTERPRTRYDDEGKWRILRQEEEKDDKKYDYLYLTENGIYAEEQAKTYDQDKMKGEGTNAQGYYEYTGDDGKLYKVVYTVGEQGFVPMADHIPTPPPIPPAIQRALDYVANKRKAEELGNASKQSVRTTTNQL